MRRDRKGWPEGEAERTAGGGLPRLDRAAPAALAGAELVEPLGAAGLGSPAAIVKAGPGKLGLVAEVGSRAEAIHAAAVEWVAAHVAASEPSGASEETGAPA